MDNKNTDNFVCSKILLQSIIIFIIFITIDILIFRDWLEVIYPLGDEFSLIVQSRHPSYQWLFSGYSNYFNIYPEYFKPFSQLFRPVANLIYWLFSPWTETGYKLQLILINYGIHSAIAATCYYLSLRLGNSKKFSYGLASIAFLTPAFWHSEMALFPSFTMDGLAAFLCLLGTYLLVTRIPWLGVFLLLLAVFTKEAALPIVVAVFLYSVLARRLYLAISSLTILSLWAGLRLMAFGHLLGGTYIFNGIDSLLLIIPRLVAFFILPVSYSTVGDINKLVFQKVFSGSLVFYAINLILWIMLLIFAKRSLSRFSLSELTKSPASDPTPRKKSFFILSLLGLACSTAYFIVIAGESRFSYVFLVCLLSTLASATAGGARIRKYIVILLAGSFLIVSILSIRELNSSKNIYVMNYKAARALVNKLHAIPKTNRRVVVVNNFIGFGGYSKESNIAKFAGTSLELIRGNTIWWSACRIEELRSISTKIKTLSPQEKILQIDLPACANFVFEGTNTKMLLENLEGSHLKRNDYISYILPELSWITSKVTGIEYVKDFGKRMTIEIKNSSVIYFDFFTGKWVYLA